MSAAIQQAAISYFGLPEGTQMVEGGPLGCFAFVIPLTEEHMRGIADRMKALSEPSISLTDRERSDWNGMDIDQRAHFGSIEAYAEANRNWKSDKGHPITQTREQLRAEYNAMPAFEKARFGSFGQYSAYSVMGLIQDDAIEPEAQGAGGRKVMHVNAPEEEQSALPEAVWVPDNELSNQQFAMVSDGKNEEGQAWCLIQVAMLTEAQRSKYAKDDA